MRVMKAVQSVEEFSCSHTDWRNKERAGAYLRHHCHVVQLGVAVAEVVFLSSEMAALTHHLWLGDTVGPPSTLPLSPIATACGWGSSRMAPWVVLVSDWCMMAQPQVRVVSAQCDPSAAVLRLSTWHLSQFLLDIIFLAPSCWTVEGGHIFYTF